MLAQQIEPFITSMATETQQQLGAGIELQKKLFQIGATKTYQSLISLPSVTAAFGGIAQKSKLK